MKILSAFAVGLILVQGCFGADSADSANAKSASNSEVWIHFEKKWAYAPEDTGPPGLRGAPVTLVKFAENGRLVILQCWINTHDGADYHVSGGDPFRVYSGEWVDENGRRKIEYKLKDVEHTPPPDDAETLFRFESAIGRNVLNFDGKEFRHSKRTITNFEEFESLGR